MPALRLAVLASGRGSNLRAILDAIARGELDAQVVGVFSDRAKAPALEHARAAGVPATALAAKGYPSREAFDEAMFSLVDAVHPDLIVCAGYMRLMSAESVNPRKGRMVNIHPSLLPAFKGLHTHQQALDAGVPEHGASVHFVSAELDGGPVIAQARVPVLPGDDAERLASRVLAREHPLLLATLRAFAAGRLRLGPDGVQHDGATLDAPLQLTADNRLAPP